MLANMTLDDDQHLLRTHQVDEAIVPLHAAEGPKVPQDGPDHTRHSRNTLKE